MSVEAFAPVPATNTLILSINVGVLSTPLSLTLNLKTSNLVPIVSFIGISSKPAKGVSAGSIVVVPAAEKVIPVENAVSMPETSA